MHSDKPPSPDPSTKNPESPPSYHLVESTPEAKATIVSEIDIDEVKQESHEKSSTTSSPEQPQVSIFDSPEFAFVGS